MAGSPAPAFPMPRHVGIIMDGNGRWARRAGMKRLRGHRIGVDAVRDVVEASAEWGIEHLTLYAFSLENWQRPKAEVQGLMAFLERFLKEEREGMVRDGVQLRLLGRRQDLPPAVQAALRETEEATAGGKRLTLRLALSYGGRQEIAEAAQALAREVEAGTLKASEVDADALAQRLIDPSMPEPDLIVRTAGELRLSNFLLWQASYAEFYFTEVLWPDFRRQHLLAALEEYHGRVRRFGKVLNSDPAVEGSSR